MLKPESLTDTFEEQERRRREASDRYRQRVLDLLDRRADLQGVSKLADLISDVTRWAA